MVEPNIETNTPVSVGTVSIFEKLG